MCTLNYLPKTRAAPSDEMRVQCVCVYKYERVCVHSDTGEELLRVHRGIR